MGHPAPTQRFWQGAASAAPFPHYWFVIPSDGRRGDRGRGTCCSTEVAGCLRQKPAVPEGTVIVNRTPPGAEALGYPLSRLRCCCPRRQSPRRSSSAAEVLPPCDIGLP